jgi:hypothetical protein
VAVTTAAAAKPQGTIPTGKGIGVIGAKVNRAQQAVDYHGGPVMPAASNVYFIWYGGWSASSPALTVLTDLATHLGGTSYFATNSLYHDAAGAAPSGDLVFGGSAVDAYSQGTSLSDANVAATLNQAIVTGQLPEDVRGIYVVLTSPDVDETSGFGSAYCGFHDAALIDGLILKFVFVGDPTRFAAKCEPQSVSPNGDAATDAMASVLAAELSNAVTDPTYSAWYDRNGLEQADKCAWSYGTTYTTASGARANIHLGTRDYLLQPLWAPGKKGGCTLGAP